ncbi:MAG TPA: LD-carboxypeptidase [Thermoanaerobaculia bacterium]|nr:LD-carboxypeptidase [Thermoanaerobaculia bacterium]
MSLASTPLTRPRPLRRDGHVAVLAASSPSKHDRIELAIRRLEAEGLRVTLAPNAFEVERPYLAGADDVRLAALNQALRDPQFDAFLFTRGGYGAMRILDRIDYAAIAANPRPIIGYSDITAIHQAVASLAGVATFHGPMLNFDFFEGLSDNTGTWFWNALSGDAPLIYHFAPEHVLAPGHASGLLFGGCLSLTHSLAGTPFDHWIDGGIWFWEDVDESTYRIDRMLTHLRLSGRLQTIQGVMIGKLKDCGGSEPAGLDLLLDEFFASAGIPVLRDMPFGHHGDNLLMPIGLQGVIDTAAGTFTIPQPVVDLSASTTR